MWFFHKLQDICRCQQNQGDSLCQTQTQTEDGSFETQDDFSYLLHQLPNGEAMRIHDSSGFELNFEVNDIRIPATPPTNADKPESLEGLEWYFEVAIIWNYKPQT